MPRVCVYTDKGELVYEQPADSRSLASATCPTNITGSSLISGLRRALEDAEMMEVGLNPERPSERAMRLIEDLTPDNFSR